MRFAYNSSRKPIKKISNEFGFNKRSFVEKIVSIRVRQTSNPCGLSENKKEASGVSWYAFAPFVLLYST